MLSHYMFEHLINLVLQIIKISLFVQISNIKTHLFNVDLSLASSIQLN